jgi:Rrf2 family transcriptional regulator, cysteine metabolism repressor
MRIPRQENVSILLMTELAKHYGQGIVSLNTIAVTHGLSIAFLKKLARLLHQAKLIESKEGVNGGYTLSKPPNQITVWDIVSTIGDSSRVSIHKLLKQEGCPLNAYCLPQNIHTKLNDKIRTSLNSLTLNDFTQNI